MDVMMVNETDREKEFEAAIRAVRAACAVTSRVQEDFADDHRVLKADQSPVTTADYAAQVVICSVLAEAFPDLPMISEESADELAALEDDTLRDLVLEYAQTAIPGLTGDQVYAFLDHDDGIGASRSWILDPVDGTKGFIRGDQYAIALALYEEGQIEMGILGCPRYATGARSEGLIIAARRGAGTVCMNVDEDRPRAVKVQDTTTAAASIVARSVESAHSSFGITDQLKSELNIVATDVYMDGQGKYGAVAVGDATMYLRIPRPGATRKENIWDHAAGVIVVEEAGGRVTDILGETIAFSHGAKLERNTGILATNGAIHDEVLSELKRLYAAASE
jgi:3'(2'), 5'-bisphosphate nucleotidase